MGVLHHCRSLRVGVLYQCLLWQTLRAFNQVMCDLKSCCDDDCKFCSILDKLCGFEKVAEWMALEPETVVMNCLDYGCVWKISWTSAMGDNNAGWQSFVLHVLGFLSDVCYTVTLTSPQTYQCE